MERLLAASDAINAVLDRIAMAVGWLFLVTTAVIVFDVLFRLLRDERRAGLASRLAAAAAARTETPLP